MKKNTIVFWGQYPGNFETKFFPLRFEGILYNSELWNNFYELWNGKLCSFLVKFEFRKGFTNLKGIGFKSAAPLKFHTLCSTPFFLVSINNFTNSGRIMLLLSGFKVLDSRPQFSLEIEIFFIHTFSSTFFFLVCLSNNNCPV